MAEKEKKTIMFIIGS